MVCSFALALLYVIGLGAYSQLAGLYDELPKYGQRIGDLVDGIQQKITAMEDQTYKVVVPARQRQEEERRRQQEQALAAAKKGKKGATPTPPAAGAAARGDPRSQDSRGEHADWRLHLFAPELASTRCC